MVDALTSSVVSHPPATDTAAAHPAVSPDGRGGQAIDAPFHVPDEVVICLPLPPTSNNLFAGTGIRRHRSSEYNAWIKEAGYRLNVQRAPQFHAQAKVSLTIEVEEPKTKQKMDLANREKACVDLLVKHRIIPGDDQNHVRELNMRWADIQGVRVTIRPLACGNGVAGT